MNRSLKALGLVPVLAGSLLLAACGDDTMPTVPEAGAPTSPTSPTSPSGGNGSTAPGNTSGGPTATKFFTPGKDLLSVEEAMPLLRAQFAGQTELQAGAGAGGDTACSEPYTAAPASQDCTLEGPSISMSDPAAKEKAAEQAQQVLQLDVRCGGTPGKPNANATSVPQLTDGQFVGGPLDASITWTAPEAFTVPAGTTTCRVAVTLNSSSSDTLEGSDLTDVLTQLAEVVDANAGTWKKA